MSMKASRQSRLLQVASGMVLAMVLSGAMPVSAQVADCRPGKLSEYLAMGPEGCAIGNIRFSHFSYSQAPNGPAASAISVTPGTVPETDDPGLLLEAPWSTPSAGSSVSYSVEVAPGRKPVSGATLEMQLGQVTGTGEARIMAELHPSSSGAGACGPAELTLNVSLDATHARKAVDDGQLKEPAQQICVVTPVSLSPGKRGSAKLQGFMTVFHFGHSQSASANPPPVPSPTGVGQ